ncbi:ABC transporter substrate-binding protein [Streptomyces candidus]|uniref:Peptide/nickel transport system substrate-binding protein n=1 Tax=Streptomyces candidus TaxID=67283 RepID=A0A7X0LRT6_9ACTN|nr:ABC transporter substrate-binding protein [Streptomyces candidus]MBB6438432.1 peptide/nickel transport system substrate-binding protein [Streptomyces candidus]GHH52395.1 ABC transporter substrate-binding protein [Streptomyces candidus]
MDTKGTTTDAPPPAPPRPARARLRRLLATGASAFALLATAAAPQGAQASQEGRAAAAGSPVTAADRSRSLTVAVSQSVDSLSPFLAGRLVSTTIHRLVYEYLTNYDVKDARTVPALATEWTSSPDKLTWTYKIRKNSTWSDGKQATAEDAAFTFNKMMTDEGAATANGSFTANFKKVTATDAETLVVELKKPQATMTALDVPIVPKHVWEKVGDFSKFNNDKAFPIVGNGPYIVTEYKPDQYVKLRANETFWRGAPKFDELILKYYKDNDAAVAALRTGEVGFVQNLTPAQAKSLSSAPDIKVNDAPGRRFFALAVNPGAQDRTGRKFGDGHPALLDPRVRRALFAAVDRKAIVDKVYQGHAVEGQGYIPPRFADYHWQPSAAQKIVYDPTAAEKLLLSAGYKKNAEGRRVGKDGKPLEFRILCHATDPNDKAIGKYLQEWWGALGIGLKVQCLDNVTDPWQAGEYDLAFDGYSVNPDPDYVLSIHTCAALPSGPGATGQTDNFICDKQFDDLYARQIVEYDKAKRVGLVKRMQSRLYDTGFMNVMVYPNAVEAYRTDQIKSIKTMPEAAGNIWGQDGYWSWWSAEPAVGDAGDDGGKGGGSGPTLWIIVGIGVLLLAAVGVVVAMRRRTTAEDRE